jgi:hypothetical protein
MHSLLRHSFAIFCCLNAALAVGCVAETDDEVVDDLWNDEEPPSCFVEQSDGTIVEAPCPSYSAQTLVPGGCADPGTKCNDIEKPPPP